MRAYVVDRYGTKDGLQLRDVTEPDVGDHDVLVEVRAAGVNRLDGKIRDGEFKLILPYRVPFVAGHDVAGVVVRVGDKVRTFAPGDEVWSRPRQPPHRHLRRTDLDPRGRRRPQACDADHGRGGLAPAGRAHGMAGARRARVLKSGQKVLIQAGSGGVGTIAIQLAKYLGAHVATTTSTANVDWVRDLGADIVVDYRREDFGTILRDYDVVLDSLGGETLEEVPSHPQARWHRRRPRWSPRPRLRQEIRAKPVVRLATTLLSLRTRLDARRRHVRYSFLFMRSSGEQLRRLAELVEAGTIRPVVDRTFPFDETNDAMAYVESGRAKGKVVITMQ